jgi:hypothetical protein
MTMAPPTPRFRLVLAMCCSNAFLLLVQATIDMMLELLAGFKISTESSTRAKQPGKVPLLLPRAPNFV